MATTIRWQDYLVPGLAAVAGGLNNRAQTGTTSSTGTGTSSTTSRNISTPTISPDAQPLRAELLKSYMDLLGKDIDLSGYKTSQLDEINKTSDFRKQATEEMLASRGTYGPAAANALTNVDNTRFADIVKFKQGLPLLQNQLDQQKLAAVQSFLSSLPTGTDTTSTQTGTSTSTATGNNTTPGNVAGGAFTGAADIISDMFLRGDLGKSLVGAGVGAGASALAGTGAAAADLAASLGVAASGTGGVGATFGAGAGTGTGGGIFGSVASAIGAIPLAGQIALGAGGAVLLAKKVFGWGNTHEKADKWVQGNQNDFDQTMANFDEQLKNGQLTPEQAKQLKDFTVDAYKKAMEKFSAEGKDQKKVIKQAKRTFNEQYGKYGYFA